MTILTLFVLDAHLPGGVMLVATVACTLLLSIVAHGLSAGPLAAASRRKT